MFNPFKSSSDKGADRLARARLARDKAALHDAESSKGWGQRIDEQQNALAERAERGEVSDQELDLVGTLLDKQRTTAKIFQAGKAARRSPWRMALTGLPAGCWWVAFLLSFTWPRAEALNFVSMALLLIGLFGFPAAGLVLLGGRTFEKRHWKRLARLFIGAGPGLFVPFAVALGARFVSPAAAHFISPGPLAFVAAGLWVWCALTLVLVAGVAGIQLLGGDGVKIRQMKAHDAAMGKKSFSLDRASALAMPSTLLPRALAVATPLLVLFVGHALVARHNPFALREVEVSALQFDGNAALAQSVAQTLKARAQEALVAGEQKSGRLVGADFLQSMATANALPGGVPVGTAADPLGGAASPRPGVQVLKSFPAYYHGVYRPAGLWVINWQPAEQRGVQNAMAAGGWFIPFYANKSCSGVIPDVLARDAQWLEDNTSGAERYVSTYTPNDGGPHDPQPYIDFATTHRSEQPGVQCVGDPIAVQAAALPAMPPRGLYAEDAARRASSFDARMAVLATIADWTDFHAWRAAGESFSQAFWAKAKKIDLSADNWKKKSSS